MRKKQVGHRMTARGWHRLTHTSLSRAATRPPACPFRGKQHAGAFGAHGLQGRGLEPKMLKNWETAAHNHLVHSVALGLASFARTNTAGALFSAGICLFSGSLYVMVLSGQRWLGAVTPVGGLALTAGWLALLL